MEPTTGRPPSSGYDLPLYGLQNGDFPILHGAALTCILSSLFCALTTIAWSCRANGCRFSDWTPGDRMVVYLALCDGLFNVSHSMDHLQIAVTRAHVRPPLLCALYGFCLAEFIAAQNLLVTAMAVNAWLLVSRGRPAPFGRGEWRLLLATFGLPFVFCCAVLAEDGFGPNGAFCYFDGVRGQLAKVFFTTVPLAGACVLNGTLYVLTWCRLRRQAGHNRRLLGGSQLTAAAARTAHTSLLFVAAFLVQWWAMATYGVWDMITAPPNWFFKAVTTFSNLGGVLNGVVFVIIRRRRARCLPATDSARTIASALHAKLGGLHRPACSLQTTPDSLHSAARSPHSTSDSLHSETGSTLSVADSQQTTLGSLRSATNSLHTISGSLHSKAGSPLTRSASLPGEANRLPAAPHNLQTRSASLKAAACK